jgi:hypothetical protein
MYFIKSIEPKTQTQKNLNINDYMALIRKRSSALTPAEQNRYITTITTLINDGKYSQLVEIHNQNHHQHSAMASMPGMGGGPGRQRFLPWHRAYLIALERELVALDPQSFVPYWDWTVEQQIPPWIAGFTPTVNVTGFGQVVVKRDPGTILPSLPDAQRIDSIKKAKSYAAFTRRLELGPHGEVHEWVGGPMADIRISPADPIFWMHHAQCDRIWSQWQTHNPGKGPTLTGANATMDPWTSTVASLNDIAALGYSYGP